MKQKDGTRELSFFVCVPWFCIHHCCLQKRVLAISTHILSRSPLCTSQQGIADIEHQHAKVISVHMFRSFEMLKAKMFFSLAFICTCLFVLWVIPLTFRELSLEDLTKPMRRQTSAEQGGQMWEAACYQLWFSLKEKRLVAAHILVAYICMLYMFVGWLGSFVGNLIVFHISPDLPLENHMFFMPGLQVMEGGRCPCQSLKTVKLVWPKLEVLGHSCHSCMGWQKAILHPEDGHEVWRSSEIQ